MLIFADAKSSQLSNQYYRPLFRSCSWLPPTPHGESSSWLASYVMLLLQTSCTVLLCVWHVLALCTWEMHVCSPVIILLYLPLVPIIRFHLLLRGCSNLCVEQCSSMHSWCKLKLLFTLFTVYIGIVLWVLRNPLLFLKACQVTLCCKMAGRRNLGIILLW